MRLTREGDYAVRLLVELAGRDPGRLVPTAELGRATAVPGAYLAKIVQVLARRGLVETRPGRRGGVALRRDPAQLTLRQMVEAVEGPIALNLCLEPADRCGREPICAVHPVWVRAQAALVRELDSVTAADLVAAGRRLARARSARPAQTS
jgi:Rrf2 family protein